MPRRETGQQKVFLPEVLDEAVKGLEAVVLNFLKSNIECPSSLSKSCKDNICTGLECLGCIFHCPSILLDNS